MAESIFLVGVGLGFLWLMAILLLDFGPIVILLFFSVAGNIILAFMTLVDIRRTWKPLVLTFGSIGLMALLSSTMTSSYYPTYYNPQQTVQDQPSNSDQASNSSGAAIYGTTSSDQPQQSAVNQQVNPNPGACIPTGNTIIYIGMRVVVPRDGGGSTKVRKVPHSPVVVAVMQEGEHATVIGGPFQCVKGTIWWQVQTQSNVTGWFVETYGGKIGIAPAPQ